MVSRTAFGEVLTDLRVVALRGRAPMTRERCREWSFRSALYVRSGQRGPPTKEIIMDELQGIVRFTFHAGMVEEFKRLSAECIAVVRSKDLGTLQYDTYFNDDESQAIVLERFRDSDALILHGQNMAPDGSHHGNGRRQRRAPGRPERAAPDPTRRQPGRCISRCTSRCSGRDVQGCRPAPARIAGSPRPLRFSAHTDDFHRRNELLTDHTSIRDERLRAMIELTPCILDATPLLTVTVVADIGAS